MLTEPQKTEIRRHLGYPEPATALNAPAGPPYQPTFGQAGPHIGDRFTPSWYDLEYRLGDLPETGEVSVLGAEAVAFPNYLTPANAFINVAATTGGAATQVSELPLQVGTESTCVSIAIGDTNATIALNIVAAIACLESAPTVVVSIATGAKVLVESRSPGARYNTFALRAWGNSDVALTVTDTSSSPKPTMTLRGGTTPPGPKFTDPDAMPQLVLYGHLPLIRFWEEQIPESAEGMDIRQAGKFIQEGHEFLKRRAAYISACRDMAQTLAVFYFGSGKNYRGSSGIIRTY